MVTTSPCYAATAGEQPRIRLTICFRFCLRGCAFSTLGADPGTITLDLGARVTPGWTVGVDRDARVVAEAHLSDPVAALVEMRRVLRLRGVLAVRDADYGGFVGAPSDPLLDRWMELYHDVCKHNGAEADAGRSLLGWAQTAGFTEIQPHSSTWTFAEPDSRQWWGELWADRVIRSSLADQALEYGLSSRDELEAIAGAWQRWRKQDDGFFVVVHAELIARR